MQKPRRRAPGLPSSRPDRANQALRRRRRSPASSNPARTSSGPVAPPPPPLLDLAGPLETTIVTAEKPSTTAGRALADHGSRGHRRARLLSHRAHPQAAVLDRSPGRGFRHADDVRHGDADREGEMTGVPGSRSRRRTATGRPCCRLHWCCSVGDRADHETRIGQGRRRFGMRHAANVGHQVVAQRVKFADRLRLAGHPDLQRVGRAVGDGVGVYVMTYSLLRSCETCVRLRRCRRPSGPDRTYRPCRSAGRSGSAAKSRRIVADTHGENRRAGIDRGSDRRVDVGGGVVFVTVRNQNDGLRPDRQRRGRCGEVSDGHRDAIEDVGFAYPGSPR